MNRILIRAILVGVFTLIIALGVGTLAADETSMNTGIDLEDDAVVYLSFISHDYGPNRVAVLGITPPSPANLKHFEKVTVDFYYATDWPDGVRIWAQPYTEGQPSPGYGYQPSDIFPPGEGSGSRWFFITSGVVTVDQIRILMHSDNNLEVLYEEFIDVEYYYSE